MRQANVRNFFPCTPFYVGDVDFHLLVYDKEYFRSIQSYNNTYLISNKNFTPWGQEEEGMLIRRYFLQQRGTYGHLQEINNSLAVKF